MAAVIFLLLVVLWTAQAAARPRAVKAAEVCWFQHMVLALAALACGGLPFWAFCEPCQAEPVHASVLPLAHLLALPSL